MWSLKCALVNGDSTETVELLPLAFLVWTRNHRRWNSKCSHRASTVGKSLLLSSVIPLGRRRVQSHLPGIRTLSLFHPNQSMTQEDDPLLSDFNKSFQPTVL